MVTFFKITSKRYAFYIYKINLCRLIGCFNIASYCIVALAAWWSQAHTLP